MGLRDVIKDLAVKKKISVAELERTLGFGNGSISKWNKQSPSVDKLNKVADYFDVSVDYLLGRTNTRSKKDNSKVALDDNDIIMTWRGQPLSDEDREMIKRIMNWKD
ncbi:helix-turn-helix domain-containing protein [Ligilactobacillus ruminis]|uniref:Helix-turn-helix domain-containing protein n=1 Tax=Ligilactobacillus ruminis TaxID=1623 RepID=A0A6A8H432_9LACO|nr:helix-turn-helix transcriptional regulator [Ligilactobacillus ruminis]MSA21382.1 helix-turn-helix domain-containing protein [Ligilactobacillus ruminis]MSA21392.1 helix-turn-helix domain-containing protein [Ligilactobacillus ruminis]MSA23436.1 helix-turn-helix domain-containing protein [Ligilactobacillus ruminis]MSA23446.1 helix-turn-helix domain-containing protein [Ligilactobacillus ruminis]MSA25279.1 helix-turn-helix domain-containing protein [Ligilactobacillus ruminis]